MRVVTATPNALYCDTDEVLTLKACDLLRSKGILGVWRYLSGLSAEEVAIILASGLELYFVNYSRLPGWVPSAAEGKLDADRDLKRLQALAIPVGVHCAFDLEGPGGTGADVEAHVEAHGLDMLHASYIPALYMGEGPRLSSSRAYAMPSRLYWASCSDIRDEQGLAVVPDRCGFGVFQGNPFDETIVGQDGTRVTIDRDFVKRDFKGRLPVGVAA